jgi:hypothetical protein
VISRLEIRRAWWRYLRDCALLSSFRRDGLLTAEQANTLALERYDEFIVEVSA